MGGFFTVSLSDLPRHAGGSVEEYPAGSRRLFHFHKFVKPTVRNEPFYHNLMRCINACEKSISEITESSTFAWRDYGPIFFD